jgi:hypothetical protein
MDKLFDFDEEEHDGIVFESDFDDMNFNHLHAEAIIHLLDERHVTDDHDLHCRYHFANIPRKSSVTTTPTSSSQKATSARNRISRRYNSVHIDEHLY